MKNGVTKILKIDSSARLTGSYSRQLTSELVNKLSELYEDVEVVERDLNADLPFLTELMIGSFYTPEELRTLQQSQSLQMSDAVIKELKEADILVLGVPIYNFTIPAPLKAWIDLMVRTGLTYKMNDNGFTSLVKNITTYVVVT